jgi:hypothetical protein
MMKAGGLRRKARPRQHFARASHDAATVAVWPSFGRNWSPMSWANCFLSAHLGCRFFLFPARRRSRQSLPRYNRSHFSESMGNRGLRNPWFCWRVIGQPARFSWHRLHRWSALQSRLSVLHGLEPSDSQSNASSCQEWSCQEHRDCSCRQGGGRRVAQTPFQTRGADLGRCASPKEDRRSGRARAGAGAAAASEATNRKCASQPREPRTLQGENCSAASHGRVGGCRENDRTVKADRHRWCR